MNISSIHTYCRDRSKIERFINVDKYIHTILNKEKQELDIFQNKSKGNFSRDFLLDLICIYIQEDKLHAHVCTSMDKKKKNNRTGHREDEKEKEQLLSSIKVEIDKEEKNRLTHCDEEEKNEAFSILCQKEGPTRKQRK